MKFCSLWKWSSRHQSRVAQLYLNFDSLFLIKSVVLFWHLDPACFERFENKLFFLVYTSICFGFWKHLNPLCLAFSRLSFKFCHAEKHPGANFFKNFYTLGPCQIMCLNWLINDKGKCNPILGLSVLTLWHTKHCVSQLFLCFRTSS